MESIGIYIQLYTHLERMAIIFTSEANDLFYIESNYSHRISELPSISSTSKITEDDVDNDLQMDLD